MQTKHLANFICGLLQIQTDNPYTINSMLDKLEVIEDPESFRKYLESRFNYERYTYIAGGFGKFVAIYNDFMKANKPRLNADEQFKANTYAEKIYARVDYIWNEIDYRTKIGMDIHDKKINLWIFNEFGEDQKALQVLQKIGDRQEILNLYRKSKPDLLEKIEKIVSSLVLHNKYPQLKMKSTHNQSEKVLKMIKIKKA